MKSDDENEFYSPDKKIRLLLVDDEQPILDALKRLFRSAPFETHTFTETTDAIEFLKHNSVDIVISDMTMHKMTGSEFLTNIYDHCHDLKTIILSGNADLKSIASAINNAHIYCYVQKPWDDEDFKLKVVNAAKTLYLERINHKQKEILYNLTQNMDKLVEERTKELNESLFSLQKKYDELLNKTQLADKN